MVYNADASRLTDTGLEEARTALRAGADPPEALLADLRRVVHAVVRWGGLPPVLSPYGTWDDEAEEEVYQGWVTERLLERGDLHSLVDRARNAGALRRMAEQSVRQWLLNRRVRSESLNLYRRVADLLDKDPGFVCARAATRRSQTSWTLAGNEDALEWGGDDRRLLAVAWSLGTFDVVRYRADAQKLPHVLNASDLRRFVVGMLTSSGCRLTLLQLTRAIELRFNLNPVGLETLDTLSETAQPTLPLDGQLALEEAVDSIIVELTVRQARILLATRAETTGEALARELNCSAATIVNERRRIGAVIVRHAADAFERDLLLKMTGDALYERS
jgi:hypothetical protein